MAKAIYTPQSGVDGELYRYLKTLATLGGVLLGADGQPWQPTFYGQQRFIRMTRLDPTTGKVTGVEEDWLQWLEWNNYSLERLRAIVADLPAQRQAMQEQMAAQAEPTPGVLPTAGVAPGVSPEVSGVDEGALAGMGFTPEQIANIRADLGGTTTGAAQHPFYGALRSYEGIPTGFSREDEEAIFAAGYPGEVNTETGAWTGPVSPENWNEFARGVVQRRRREEQARLGALPPEQFQEQWTQYPGAKQQAPLTWPQTPNWVDRWQETRGDMTPWLRNMEQGRVNAMAEAIRADPRVMMLSWGLAPDEISDIQSSPWAQQTSLKDVNQWIRGGRTGTAPWATPPPGWGVGVAGVSPGAWGGGGMGSFVPGIGTIY